MKRTVLIAVATTAFLFCSAQKKPLDHSVYDSWQHIGEQLISNDGKWVVYTIDPQEGDNELIIQSSDGIYKKSISRGYSAHISENSRYVIFKIKPFYKDTREARIKKKKPDDMPKDSLGIVELGKEMIWKAPKVKTYKTPEKGSEWIAYHLEKVPEAPSRTNRPDNNSNSKKISDSLNRIIDSLQQVISSMPEKKKKNKDEVENDDGSSLGTGNASSISADFADGDESSASSADAGTDLVLRKLANGQERVFNNVLEYYFSKQGDKILIEQAKNPKDSLSKASVSIFDFNQNRFKPISKGGNDFKNFVFSDDGSQVAYLAERDVRPKELQKFYKIWYYNNNMDTAQLIADKNTVDMKLGMTISEYGNLDFSKNGKRLFFGVAPIQPPRDTNLVEFDYPKLDIWHYNDDYLQTVQNFPGRLRSAQQENFLSVYDFDRKTILQLGSKEIPQVIQTNEGDGDVFIGVTDFGKRVESQWLGNTVKDIYAIDVNTAEKKLVKQNLFGQVYPSSTGKYVLWYDRNTKNYFIWDGSTTKNITQKIKVPLWNELGEVPEMPGSYGVMGWDEQDQKLFIYDRFDIWEINPANSIARLITDGRKAMNRYRYLRLDPDEKFIPSTNKFLRLFNENNKNGGLTEWSTVDGTIVTVEWFNQPMQIGNIIKAKNSGRMLLSKETFQKSGDLYSIVKKENDGHGYYEVPVTTQLSFINPQQENYSWGTAELFKWKAYNGKDATGIVYKPEDFDPKKKYPMIVYFYETLSDALFDYKEPAPIRSAINIPFFVSRGYIIFLPDIHYTTGHPGQNAYDYIVSGSRALVKKGWVDSTNMGLQGHSWGGYQAAILATKTKMFKAIWAGAPVANMTSAYGGIRWESGVSRQFQYEKTQSRIGATLWEKPNLYIENSPLFHLDKVTAPMVIMANDADGAVPWYQGIELFSGLRRLGKKVWMFNYNGQGHGLTQRQDMRDYQIRMQQWFDWMLKEEKPAKWITEGLPAVRKGKEWGLEIVQ